MRKLISQINYIYIFIVLIWETVQCYILQFDGMRRTLFFLAIPVFITNILYEPNIRKLLSYKPIFIWGLWVIYSCINSMFKGTPYESKNLIFFIGDFIVAYIVMILVCKEYLKNTLKLLKFLIFTLSIYVLMGVSNIGINVLGNERFIDEKLGNLLPLNIVLLIFFICHRIGRKELMFWNVVMIVILLLLVILSGTRKALGGALIISACTIFSFFKLKSYKTTFMAIASFIILFIGYQYVMENTLMGERISEVEEVGMALNTTDYPILNLLGDRSDQYILGWEVFTENPITGIGLGNFREVTFSDYVIHSEYIVQLVECGFIGSMLFLLFIFWIGLHLFRCWKDYIQMRSYSLIILGGFLAILFIGFTSWIYSWPFYFVGFGIIIAFLKQNRNFKYEKY